MTCTSKLVAAVVLALALTPAGAAAVAVSARTPSYVRTDLPSLGGGTGYAVAINDAGVVAGNSTTSAGYLHAVVWTGGQVIDLGAAPGRDSIATAITASGHVLGQSYKTERPGRAFLWRDGRRTSLGTLGGRTSEGLAINSNDEVVGVSETADREQHAFVWRNGVMTDLGTLGGSFSEAMSINDAGVIVGTAETSGRPAEREPSAPVRWDNDVVTRLPIPFARPPDGQGAPPRWQLLINDAGVIAGSVTSGGTSGNEDSGSRLFRIVDGGVIFAGPALPSTYVPNAINAGGDVVAYRYVCCVNESQGVVWPSGRHLRTIVLPAGAGDEPNPRDINDSGVVVGQNFSPSRQPIAFVRQPGGRASLLTGFDLESAAVGVTTSGVIAGWTATPETAQTTCIWTPTG